MVTGMSTWPLFCWHLHSSPSDRQVLLAIHYLLRVFSGVLTPLYSWVARSAGPAVFPGSGAEFREVLKWGAVCASGD